MNQINEGVRSEVPTTTCQKTATGTACVTSQGSSKGKSSTLPTQLNSASSLSGKGLAPAKRPSSRPTDFFQR